MRATLRRIRYSDPWFTMVSLAVATMFIGGYLLNPNYDTFSSGAAWRMIDQARIGRFHPDEATWGAAFLVLGLSMALSLLLLSAAVNERSIGRLAEIVFGFSRLVWGFGAMFWAGVGSSFYLSNPAGIAPILAVIFGTIPSAWVATRVRKAVMSARGVGGGR